MNLISEWIKNSESSTQVTFRSVIHIILHAIANHHELRSEMIMKGGILAAILYDTGRFTKDVDFSTPKHYREFEKGEEDFIAKLNDAIIESSAELSYGISCRIQSHELKPGPHGNYQTLHLRVGYALRNNPNSMKRLEAGQASNTVDIDYSFNELIGDISIIDTDSDNSLEAYGQLTLMAEKYRALIQQANVEGQRKKGSSRGQDIFDLNILINNKPLTIEQQDHLLALLIQKSEARDVIPTKYLIRRDEIREKCKIRYDQLANEVPELPDFFDSFENVVRFYENLPWPIDRQK